MPRRTQEMRFKHQTQWQKERAHLFKPLPIDADDIEVNEEFTKAWEKYKTECNSPILLIAIGGWQNKIVRDNNTRFLNFIDGSIYDNDFPKPQNFIQQSEYSDKAELLKYLKKGQLLTSIGNEKSYKIKISHRRLKCHMCNLKIKEKKRSDGKWIWTDEYIHYIKCHSILIPLPFVEDIRLKNYVIPKKLSLRAVMYDPKNPTRELYSQFNFKEDWTFWIAFGKMMSFVRRNII